MSAPPRYRVVPLEFLNNQESGTVLEVVGDETVVHRLSEMGLREGICICMIRSGTPCILQIGEHRLTLRIDATTQVLIEVAD